MELWNKTRVLKEGRWPDYFLKDLVSPIPPLTASAVKTRLTWHCHKHGDYQQTILCHLKAPICYSCSCEKSFNLRVASMKNTLRSKHDYENLDFLETSLNWKYGMSYNEKLHFVCSKHGDYYKTVANAQKCPSCPKCKREEVETERRLKRWSESKRSYIVNFMVNESDKSSFLSGGLPVNTKCDFKCPNGHLYNARISDQLQHGCPICAATEVDWRSDLEKELIEVIKSWGVEVQNSVRTLVRSDTGRPLELDIYLPELKLAIEVNGVYWHSIEHMEESSTYNALGGKKNYHLMKTEACKKEGIRLIHLFEDDLKYRWEVCLGLIKSKMVMCGFKSDSKRIFARQTDLRRVPIEEAKRFLDSVHINGVGRGSCYGLYYQGQLISLVQIRKSPENEHNGYYVLDRYAVDSEFCVVAGFQKLMKNVVRLTGVKKWITYADRVVSDGDLYRNDGWQLINTIPPDYKYVVRDKRYHKFNYRIDRFKEDPNLKYVEGMTEFELAKLNGIRRIYDCGKYVYEKTYD